MNRIDQMLIKLKDSGQKMLSPYLTAGDPTRNHTVPLMHALVSAGANCLEIGIPFSDPMAEGPVIQAAMERALQQQVTPETVFEMVAEFRQQDQQTPIVLMGYLNPIEQYGYVRFAQQAVAAGVDGTIIVDLPPEESESIQATWDEENLYPIYLCSPTTSPERFQLIQQRARGYLYFVSIKGVTGANASELETIKKDYLRLKAQTHLPLMVGFGIKTPERAAQMARFADGVIVGAALIEALYEGYCRHQDGVTEAAQFTAALRQAIDSGKKYD